MNEPEIRRLIVFFVCLVLALTPALQAQTLPGLPPVSYENFGAEIRDHVRKAYTGAQASPSDAEAVGRLGMTLHTYEEYEGAAVCYEHARRLAELFGEVDKPVTAVSPATTT